MGDLKEDLIEAFNYLLIPVHEESHTNFFARHFGFLCDTHYVVQSVDSSSPYIHLLGKGDRILRINDAPAAEFSVEQLQEPKSIFITYTNGIHVKEIDLNISEMLYFKTLQIKLTEESILLK